MKALRKRIPLKSPVRKIRTPGSVRGLPGNRQSYRDGSFSACTTLCSGEAMYILSKDIPNCFRGYQYGRGRWFRSLSFLTERIFLSEVPVIIAISDDQPQTAK